jgi:hypothetical protein
VGGLIVRLGEYITPDNMVHWQYITRVLPASAFAMPAISPAAGTFGRYHSYFERYYAWAVSRDVGAKLPERLEQALAATGLAKRGWRVEVKRNAAHAQVHQGKKVITVGADYLPRTRPAADRIVVHEVFGHALRGMQSTVGESEGFAILLEQLLDDRFKFRRSYRYLAAGLGWGALGRPMTFREVYEIIWRAMVIVGTYKEAKAKKYAFDECARVFRGGLADVPGAVYLKDSVYFAANIAMWQRLGEAPLSYEQFVDVIEGRRKILS